MSDSFGPDRMESRPPMLLAGIRREHRMATVHESMAAQWQDFRRLGLTGIGPPRAYGAYCSMSMGGFEYLSGVEVASFDGLGEEVGRMRVPAQQYAVFRHDGNVGALGETWGRIWRDWLPRSGYVDAETPPFELYDGAFDPETGDGGLEIWFPVRQEDARGHDHRR